MPLSGDDAPQNPWPVGSPEAAEYDAIVARLANPALERRYARALSGVTPQPGDPDAIAGHLERLSAAGVLFGPDCSQFQGLVDWGKVRTAGCLIAGYKVSEGRTYEDPQHRANRRNAPAAGLVPLAYHYMAAAGYAGRPDLVQKQADWYCSLVDPQAIHALDVEAVAPAPGLDVNTWVARYFTHFPNKTLAVYSNHGMWTARSHVATRAPGGRVVTWHAGVGDGYYTSARGTLPAEWAATGGLHDSMAQLGFPAARLWQFTDHASVPGVSGLCDGNAFAGTPDDLRALAGTATPKPPQPGTPTIYGPVKDGDNDNTTPALHGSVRAIQRFLGITTDGVFGRRTMIATQNWQSRRGLTADGVWGPASATRAGFHYAAR